jgi:hypothetical protein
MFDRPKITKRKKRLIPRRPAFETLDRMMRNYERPMLNGYFIPGGQANKDATFLINGIMVLAKGPRT